MSDLIETKPTQPYFGEIFDSEAPLDDVTRLASPLPQFYQPYNGNLPPRQLNDQIVAPVLLPVAEGDEGDCFWSCLTGLPVSALAGVGGAAAASGMIPKSWVGMPRGMANASRFTSLPSIIAHRVPSLGRIQVPRGIPNRAPVLRGAVPHFLPTKGLLRFIGRWIPGIGWCLLAADVITIDQCVAHCTGHRSILLAACQELTPFCPKPAY